jgi:hypothetical protein
MSVSVSVPFVIHYKKIKILDLDTLVKNYQYLTKEDETNEYNPFLIDQFQNYNPIYSEFFELTDTNYNTIGFNHTYHFDDIHQSREYHIKYSPLLDPLHYMIGKYDFENPAIRCLPTIHNKDTCFPKFTSTHNVSYIDSFFSFLSSQTLHHHNMLNGIEYYGSYLGIQRRFKATITDDLEYLYSSDKFMQNLGKQYWISDPDSQMDNFANIGSRANKHKIRIGSCNVSLDAEVIEPVDNTGSSLDNSSEDIHEIVYEKDYTLGGEDDVAANANRTASTSSSLDSNDLNYSSGEDDDNDQISDLDNYETASDSDSESDSYNESEVYAYIKDFPMQMIVLEKCFGTLDELFVKDEVDKEKGAAYLMQIIMSLIVYQKAFQFTHNDLHTNNIMYINTEQEYLYYKYNNKCYKVPTYGKIFKLIDFGRAIYRFQGKIFCSDSFAPGGDAHTQYNCEPFLNESKPRIDPNPSFDLCRLGCSIYDFIVDDEDNGSRDMFQETISRWCQDDNGKHMLYKRNGEERYPNFKLYKMIARNVHKHTPQSQLETPFFDQFRMNTKTTAKVSSADFTKWGIDIDSIPSYV